MKGRWIGRGCAVVLGLLLVGLVAHVYLRYYGMGNADAERGAALKAARQVQASTGGNFWVATYTPNAGAHQPSNTGHSCFGSTVLVRLVWKNAGFTHSGISSGPIGPRRCS